MSKSLENDSFTASFNPARLTLARMRRGLTKAKLAGLADLDRRSIRAFEADEYPPSDETLDRIADVLDFPPEFFFGDDLDVPQPDVASFRAASKMTASQRDMALAQGALALHLNRWLESEFGLPEPQLPDLGRDSSPEEAAIELRYFWGWGESPISNMIHLMESKGIRVFSLSIDSREVDAFSMWQGEIPLVFLNSQKSAERSRFDAAHELGHLVLHRHSTPNGRDAEREADQFASAFLMPKRGLISQAPRFPTIARLIELKHHWKVSLVSLVYRLHALQLMNDWNYRSLISDISRKGYRVREPQPIERETSQVFSKALTALRKEGVTKSHLAQELRISESELDYMMFGLVMTSLRGGASRSPEVPKVERSRRSFKVVK